MMNLNISREKLYSALQIVSSVISSRSTLPVLQNVKIDVREEKLTLYATDLTTAIRYHLTSDIKIQKQGSAIVNAQKFLAILRESKDKELLLEIDEDKNNLTIQGATSLFHLLVIDEEFPAFPEVEKMVGLEFEYIAFNEMVRRTSFATSDEPARYTITGVLLELVPGELRMVATDTKRLAFAKRKDKKIKDTIRIIVPSRTLNLVERIRDNEDTFSMFFHENQVMFSSSKADLFSRLIEGQYPEYEKVIHPKLSHRVKVNRDAFAAALKQSMIVISDMFKSVDFHIEAGKMTLFAQSHEYGDSKVAIEAEYSGKPFSLKFNPTLFIDVLKYLNSDEVTIEFGEAQQPARIVEGKEYIYLAMPLSST